MNFDLNWDVKQKVSHWWEVLAASVVASSSGLGAYLGQNSLTLVQVQKGLSGIQVGHSANFIIESGKMADLATMLKETVAAWDLETCPVSLAVSPTLGFFRPATLPRAALENLAKVVSYELDRFLPLAADNLYYSFQVLDETDSEIHLMLMALPRDRVEPCLGLLTEATLRPVALELAPVAAGNVFAVSPRALPSSWLLLHLQDGSFELTHFYKGKLKAFVHNHDLQGKGLTDAIMAQVEDLAAALPASKVLGLYGSAVPDFKVGALKKYDLEVIYPYHLIQDLNPELDPDTVLPAAGAGLSCIGKAPLAVNLLPPGERTNVRPGRFSFTATLLLVFLGLVFLWGTSALIQTRVQLYRVNREIVKLTPEAEGVEKLLQESQALAKQIESLNKVKQSPDKLIMLKELTQLIPDDTWLFTLQLSKQSVDLTGMSRSASDLIPLLDKSGLLNKTEFVSPIITDANKLEHFKIKAEFKGLAPGL